MEYILIVIGLYALLSIVLVPMQYKYVKSLKEMEKERNEMGLTQNEYYEKMRFEYQELHLNAQGNSLFIGANLLASLLYKWKHKE